MSAADDDGSRRLVHAGEHFRNGKSRLDVAADRVDNDEQSVQLRILLNRRKQRQILSFSAYSAE